MKFHHLGIACMNIEKTLAFIQETMTISTISDSIFDELQQATLCMVTLQDGTKLELISGPVVQSYLKRNIHLYHSCYVAENIEETLQLLETKGCRIISPPKPALLFNNQHVAFLTSPLGLIELIEGDSNV